jgi:16S rRNA (adenine1518-N6/adenine1519-N6)-dimethyltransferase
VMGDVMDLDLPELMAGRSPFHVAANLPYYLTTPILTLLFRLPLPILSVNVMVQQEAARRVLAAPGTPEYGPLAVLASYRSLPRETLKVPASKFTPPPKVDSVFLVMPFLLKTNLDPDDEEFLFRLVTAGFAMRRKTLANNLMAAYHFSRGEAQSILSRAGLSGDIRGERLSLEEYMRLADCLKQESDTKI